MPTPNDLNTAYNDYRDHPGAETINVLCALIRSYARRVALAQRYRDPEEAADSIMAVAWASLSTFRGEAKFTTWLHTLIRRRLLNMIRTDQRHPLIQVDDHKEQATPLIDSSLLEVETLSHLSDVEKHLVQLFIETPDYDRLADRLRISRRALQNRLKRISLKSDRNLSCAVSNLA